ncbi:hypothetical protein [Alkalimarinus sediminis]|uniref:Uncharacterized protein n=1 Tax=Alkalimarinus sediminis TaxID=1632866 RepID=A0A9E8HF04_9ALTE|nr:hypothetical protein [Alkalimarinus sediminis]UZW73423.1 hypothetical protein NNL22_10205 [Alkalimarinus sediminis]
MFIKTDTFAFIIIFAIPYVFLLQSTFGFILILFLLALFVFANLNKGMSSNTLLLISFYSIFVFPVIVSFQHGFSHVFYYSMTLLLILASNIVSNLDIKRLLLIFGSLFWSFVTFSLIVYYYNRDLSEPFSGLVEGSSTNGIPSYLIVLQIVYSLTYYIVNKRLPVVAVLFTILIAIFGIGRGSIYTAVLIMLCSVSLNFYIDFMTRRYRSVSMVLVVFIVLFLFVVINIDVFVGYLEARTKALQGLNDPYRNRILYEYVSLMSWWQVLIGGEYQGTVISSLYEGNPHISFIRSHAYLGLFYTLAIILSPLLFIFYTKRLIDSLVFLSFTSILLLRSLSEPILFPTALDLFYYLIFFMYFRNLYQYKASLEFKWKT